MKNSVEDILSFWFSEIVPAQWFQVNVEFDQRVRDRFLDLFYFAKTGLYQDWAMNADGALALIILFDQFPRVMFRDMAEAYSTDALALDVADKAIARGFDQMFVPLKRRFFYLPFEHSEDMGHQQRSLALCEGLMQEDPLRCEYALRHMRQIEQFGRFPHRNKILGRESSPEEIEYLKNKR
jgi:uncharacterized protein (DUF924 family)